MIIIRGSVLNALWRTEPVSIPVPDPPIFPGPQWGLGLLDRTLSELSLGEVVLITGESESGKSSLARTIALASAEVGFHVDFSLSSRSNDETTESRWFAAAAVGSNVAGEGEGPLQGEVVPTGPLTGQIRLYEGRPALLEHEEDNDSPPHILICDDIDTYLGLDGNDISRAVVLEKLREYAVNNNCLVVAISEENEASTADFCSDPRLWEQHVGKHLHIDLCAYEEHESEVRITVVKDGGHWPDQSILVADQTNIGRLGEFEADVPDYETQSLFNLIYEPTAEQEHSAGEADEISGDKELPDLQQAIEKLIAQLLSEQPEHALRILRLTQTMSLLGEDATELEFSVQPMSRRERITTDSVLNFGDGADYLCSDAVDVDVSIGGQRIAVVVELRGTVTYSLNEDGRFFDLNVSDVLTLDRQRV